TPDADVFHACGPYFRPRVSAWTDVRAPLQLRSVAYLSCVTGAGRLRPNVVCRQSEVTCYYTANPLLFLIPNRRLGFDCVSSTMAARCHSPCSLASSGQVGAYRRSR